MKALRLLLLALAVSSASAAVAAPRAPAPAKPRLLVFVSVDQMRFDYLTRFDGVFTGGFRTLLDRGAVFANARYRHANTETGPGHAVLLSGRSPSHSGIVANEWYDPLTHGMVNVVDDPAQSPVGGGTGRGASPVSFLGFTVGDVLKKASPRSRVVAVAGKDRAAVLMAGHRGDAAYWFDSSTGGFGSSTYYMRALPPWLAAWNAGHRADRMAGRAWNRLLPDASLYARLAGPDAAAGESDGVDTAFPHALRGRAGEPQLRENIRATPFLDELILDVALRAADAGLLGRRGVTDVLAIGFSATDGIGHAYGPDSQEAMDQMLRLDRVLQRLLAALEQRVGRGNALFALSADHGVMPLVETRQARGEFGARVSPAVFEAAVRTSLEARFPGALGLVAQMDAPHVYLDLDAVHRQGLDRAAVEAAVAEGLMSTGVLERTYTHAELMGEPPRDDPAFALFRGSFFAPRSPHVIGRLREGVYVTPRSGGTTHGSYHEYDRHVPIVFLGARVAAGRYDAPCGPEDIAPTLAALLGLPYPLQDAERVLAEMIRN